MTKTSEADREGLDLSQWRMAFCGAEPIRSETIDRFTKAFAPLLVPDRHVDVPPLLYLLGAGAVIYYVALVLSRRRP